MLYNDTKTCMKGGSFVPRGKTNIPKTDGEQRKRKPALSPEARENQMIALAMDLAEQRLRDGTASSQEVTHFLKLASSKERLEKEIMEKQKALIEARTNAYASSDEIKALYADAMAAFRSYNGQNG
jgi:hypothetical protein